VESTNTDLVLVTIFQCFQDIKKNLFEHLQSYKQGKYIEKPEHLRKTPFPRVPNLYEHFTRESIDSGRYTREQLASVSVYMANQAKRHPDAMGFSRERSLEKVLNSRPVSKNITMLECAWPCSGGACFVVCSKRWLQKKSSAYQQRCAHISFSSFHTNPRNPPPQEEIPHRYNAFHHCVYDIFLDSGLSIADIDWFGIYDCFPVVFLDALQELGVTKNAGKFIFENMHEDLPINTHGGLLAFGAPINVPAAFSAVEAVRQMRGTSPGRQFPSVKNVILHGNGGIKTFIALMILQKASPLSKL